jgi:hypothetical protein
MPYTYGLRDIRIVSMDDAVAVDLPAARTLTFTERIQSAELRGDDVIVSQSSYPDAVEWSLEAGGYPLEAIELMTGHELVPTGVAPNVVKTLTALGGQSYPYFQIYGQSLGDDGDDLQVHIPKAKLTAAPSGTWQDQNFFIMGASGVGLQVDDGAIYIITHRQTAGTLPATT